MSFDRIFLSQVTPGIRTPPVTIQLRNSRLSLRYCDTIQYKGNHLLVKSGTSADSLAQRLTSVPPLIPGLDGHLLRSEHGARLVVAVASLSLFGTWLPRLNDCICVCSCSILSMFDWDWIFVSRIAVVSIVVVALGRGMALRTTVERN